MGPSDDEVPAVLSFSTIKSLIVNEISVKMNVALAHNPSARRVCNRILNIAKDSLFAVPPILEDVLRKVSEAPRFAWDFLL
ncbi:hypothetical protein C7438_0743 [Brockia lithotrophica]|uniref:Uncharacterized protein n=1 Tax=Brockia lithotrophica TaxID=933949 RepID=A0A660L581_9BACL|nr:hypothetical protein C7438_0743 [Brockia lithotrophica]